jgi:hypothetical protein
MIENGLSFQLVPWQPVLEKRIGQHITGLQRDDLAIEDLGKKPGTQFVMHARAACDIEIVKAMHSTEQIPQNRFRRIFPASRPRKSQSN